ncbi:MAG: hypothetical protein Q7R35_15685 [Elusimicrobiota bacterium]|nr:hypothetical protein [Elusimicrobiota bacterium]
MNHLLQPILPLVILAAVFPAAAGAQSEPGKPKESQLSAEGKLLLDGSGRYNLDLWGIRVPPPPEAPSACGLPVFAAGQRSTAYRGGCEKGAPQGTGEYWQGEGEDAVYFVGDFCGINKRGVRHGDTCGRGVKVIGNGWKAETGSFLPGMKRSTFGMNNAHGPVVPTYAEFAAAKQRELLAASNNASTNLSAEAEAALSAYSDWITASAKPALPIPPAPASGATCGKAEGGPRKLLPYRGTCKAGWLEGPAEVWLAADQGYLIADFKQGVIQGRVISSVRDGSFSVADAFNNLKSGRGNIWFAGDIHYRGAMNANRFHGQGALAWPDGKTLEGRFSNDALEEGTASYPDGRWEKVAKIEGMVRTVETSGGDPMSAEGRGALAQLAQWQAADAPPDFAIPPFPVGSTCKLAQHKYSFRPLWVSGPYRGKCGFRGTAGGIGEAWRGGSDGSRQYVVGEFSGGAGDGMVALFSDNGTVFIGRGNNGEFFKGTLWTPDGARYEGELRSDAPSGRGERRYRDGRVESGAFRGGRLIEGTERLPSGRQRTYARSGDALNPGGTRIVDDTDKAWQAEAKQLYDADPCAPGKPVYAKTWAGWRVGIGEGSDSKGCWMKIGSSRLKFKPSEVTNIEPEEIKYGKVLKQAMADRERQSAAGAGSAAPESTSRYYGNRNSTTGEVSGAGWMYKSEQGRWCTPGLGCY